MAVETATAAALLNLRATAVLLQLLELALVRRDRVTKAERQVRVSEGYVKDHYARIKSVNEISAAVGLGADYLPHLFRNLRGKSLVGYLGEVRLARAKVLLAHSNLPLKEVAPLCGYRDEYYFSACFGKRHSAEGRISSQFAATLFEFGADGNGAGAGERAKVFLRDPKMTVSDAAYAAGFRDPGYFARCFRKQNGVTPTAFR